MWQEVEIAKKEQRHELVLHGKDVASRVQKNEGTVDENVFSLGGWMINNSWQIVLESS